MQGMAVHFGLDITKVVVRAWGQTQRASASQGAAANAGDANKLRDEGIKVIMRTSKRLILKFVGLYPSLNP